MAPGHYDHAWHPVYSSKGGNSYYNNPNHHPSESDLTESANNKMNEIVTTVKNIISAVVTETITVPSDANQNAANENAGDINAAIPNAGSDSSANDPNPGIAEMMNITLTNLGDTMQDNVPGITDMLNNTPSIGGADDSMMNSTLVAAENGNQMFNTSFELVTTELNDWSTPMMHHGVDDNYDGLIYIILGLVLGVLIITVLTLAVVYNHYRKRGFQEIAGSNDDKCDPPSMQKLEQACSEDTLLKK